MSTNTPQKQRPVLIIPPSPRITARRPPRKYKGPHPFTILLALVTLIALGRLLYTLISPSSTSASLQNTPLDCNGLLRANDYTKSVGLQQGEQLGAVESVNQLDGGAAAVLAQVTHGDTHQTLDVYVFGCSIRQDQPRLTTLFTQRGLVEGSVEVSQADSLITSTLDPSITADSSDLLLPDQQNIYREYAWSNGALQQVTFPGFYPVASRAEAEALQQQADNGQNSGQSTPTSNGQNSSQNAGQGSGQMLIWTDPLATAEAMAKDIFQWQTSSTQATLLSNDGATAQVQLVEQNPSMVVQVTLQRLVQQDSKGLWFVVAAHTAGITLGLNGEDRTTLPLHSAEQPPVQSPLMLQGTGVLADGQTSATLFDHTLAPITSASNISLQANSDGTFSGSLPYSVATPGQEGLLLVQSLPQAANNAVEQGQLLLVPVLLA